MNVLCIAGFLGSGKTTILLEVARSLTEAGSRVAVIENEIGEVGVDGGYVREQGLPVQEIFGGCICCTLQIGLVQTLETLTATHSPDWVLLEPTGLASPGDILGLLVDNVEDLDVLRVLTVVDAARWPMLLEVVEPLVTSQLQSADVVSVNKADEVSAEELESVMASVRSLTSADARVLAVSAAKGTGMRALLRAAP